MCLCITAGKSHRQQLQLTVCCHKTLVDSVHAFTSSIPQATVVVLSPNSGLRLEQMAVTRSDLLLGLLWVKGLFWGEIPLGETSVGMSGKIPSDFRRSRILPLG